MNSLNGGAAPSSDKEKSSLGALLEKLRKLRIIETLAGGELGFLDIGRLGGTDQVRTE